MGIDILRLTVQIKATISINFKMASLQVSLVDKSLIFGLV